MKRLIYIIILLFITSLKTYSLDPEEKARKIKEDRLEKKLRKAKPVEEDTSDSEKNSESEEIKPKKSINTKTKSSVVPKKTAKKKSKQDDSNEDEEAYKKNLKENKDQVQIQLKLGYNPNFTFYNQTGDFESQGTTYSLIGMQADLDVKYDKIFGSISYDLSSFQFYNDQTTKVSKSNNDIWLKFGYDFYYLMLGNTKTSEYLLAKKDNTAEWSSVSSLAVGIGLKKEWIKKKGIKKTTSGVDLSFAYPLSSSSELGVLKMSKASGYIVHFEGSFQKELWLASSTTMAGLGCLFNFEINALKHNITLDGTTNYSVNRSQWYVKPQIYVFLTF